MLHYFVFKYPLQSNTGTYLIGSTMWLTYVQIKFVRIPMYVRHLNDLKEF